MIPNGIGPMTNNSRHAARRKLGIADDDIVIGSIGRLVEVKAPDVLIRAFAVAYRSEPRLRLVVVGDGPLKHSLQKLCRTLQISERVCLPGEIDAPQVLSAFDIYAISSRKEGMPYVVLEAMASGLPVIATTTAGAAPGQTGNQRRLDRSGQFSGNGQSDRRSRASRS